MRKKVVFVILDQYADWECAYLSSAIKEMSTNEVEVKTLSLSVDPVFTIGGFKTIPDYSLETVPEDMDGLVLVGGKSWVSEDAKKLLPLITKEIAKNTVVAGICAASEFLAAHGFLNEVKHTSNGIESIAEWEANAYINSDNYMQEQSVRDGKIITANGSAPLEFARDVLGALDFIEEEKISEWYQFQKMGLVEFLKQLYA